MKKIIMTKGLPGSGKSTWAKEYIEENTGVYRVNKDDLRQMLWNGKYSKSFEKHILSIRDKIVEEFLSNGHNVIIDDTNLHSKHEERMKEIAKEHNAIVEIKDFTNVSVETCIENDLKRANSVGSKVIMSMYRNFIQENYIAPMYDENLPDCFIFDIDGTLAHRTERSPYDWARVGEDNVDERIFTLYKSLLKANPNALFILVSGRDESCRKQTLEWLGNNAFEFEYLYMRPHKNTDKDYIVKRQIFETYIKGNYNVLAVFDDRDQTVQEWRRLGLKCLQVAEGDF